MKSLKMLLRFAIVGGLILLLLIPLMMIRGVINERSAYRDEAYSRVAESRAGTQRLIGPVRVVPWVERQQVEVVDAQGVKKTEMQTTEGQWLQVPTTLEVNGELLPSQRSVGLFKVPVYSWNGQVKASFAADDYPVKAGRSYGQPYVALGVSDARGLVGTPNLRVDGQQVRLQPGVGAADVLGRGLHAPVAGFADDGGGTLAAARDNPTLKAAIPLAPWHTTKNFSSVKVPTLIVACESDIIAPVSSHAQRFYDSMSAATPHAILELAGANHFCVNNSTSAANKAVNTKMATSWLKVYMDGDRRYAPFLQEAKPASNIS